MNLSITTRPNSLTCQIWQYSEDFVYFRTPCAACKVCSVSPDPGYQQWGAKDWVWVLYLLNWVNAPWNVIADKEPYSFQISFIEQNIFKDPVGNTILYKCCTNKTNRRSRKRMMSVCVNTTDWRGVRGNFQNIKFTRTKTWTFEKNTTTQMCVDFKTKSTDIHMKTD